jgi:hypothetical protein
MSRNRTLRTLSSETASSEDALGVPAMGLSELVSRVASDGDTQCLHELLERRSPFHDGSRFITLSDHLFRLRKQALANRKNRTDIIDKAYDLTVDKFSHLPDASLPTGKSGIREPLKHGGSDCRYYYWAFLEMVRKSDLADSCESEVELECEIGQLLKRFVTRHFYLSLLEARRSANPAVSRYVWRVNGKGSITLWMPKTVRGAERRTWLEENVVDFDPSRPNERDRVQAIVDARLSRGTSVPFHQLEHGLSSCAPGQKRSRSPSLPEDGGVDLPRFIADEKADSLDLQRPAIRALGRATLKKLVLAVFENISERCRSEEALAASFGLSKSAFSRFGGSRWDRVGEHRKGAIPDLWLNLSQVLSRESQFVDVAQRAGVLQAARDMTQENARIRLRTDAHE